MEKTISVSTLIRVNITFQSEIFMYDHYFVNFPLTNISKPIMGKRT